MKTTIYMHMKKYILISGALLSMMSCAAENKDVTVTLPADGPDKS